ncbi:hypothetical protein P7C70_g4471, partial [Phenoliferia sp. Uapishka_3]
MDAQAGPSSFNSPSASNGSATLGGLPSRSSRACFACSRRKTKCDHSIPCSACVKRGQAHACTAPEKRKRGIDPLQELDERRTAALSEIELFRNTLDTLRARLPNLEHFIANSSAPTGEQGEFEDVARMFGNPDQKGFGNAGSSDVREREDGGRSARGDAEGERERKRLKLGMGGEYDRERSSTGTDLDESEAVEAAVDLEFMTLGRSRTFPTSNDRSPGISSPDDSLISESQASILTPPTFNVSPIKKYPDGNSLLHAAPTLAQEDVILRQGIDFFGWHHRVFHAPTFYAQVSAFWELGEERFDVCSPAWLALYFAMLSVGTKLLGPQEQDRLDWDEEETAELGGRWFECCIACLYRQNFLENHDIHSLQAIALLTLTGRDAGSPSLIANLLSSGLSIAQDLGLHRMPSDASFAATALDGKSAAVRSKALIDREIRKRIIWALAHSDWFAIPFRRSWVLGKVHILTPLPLNIHDEDLSRGEMISRPASEFTCASWLLQYIEIGHQMQDAFEQSQTTGDPAYQAFLKIDAHIGGIITNPPAWLSPTSAIAKRPYFEYMRSTFLISVHHKLLSIHRPYMHKPYKGMRMEELVAEHVLTSVNVSSLGAVAEYSRRRVVTAARAILREAANARDGRIWTFLVSTLLRSNLNHPENISCQYHISAAAFIIMLELFARAKHGSVDEWEAMRQEIRSALPILERLTVASPISVRGLALVQPLLAQEQRLKEEGVRPSPRSEPELNRGRSSSGKSVETPQETSFATHEQHPPPPRQSYPLHHPAYLNGDVSTPSPYDSFHLPPPIAPGAFDYHGSATTGVYASALPNWFYDLGTEHSEEWLHSQLSGAGLASGDGFDGWGNMATLPGGDDS